MENDKIVWITIPVAIVLLVLLFGGVGMGGYSMMGFGAGFGVLFMILFWGFIIWIVVTLINTGQSNKNDNSDSLTILKKSYAKGEITKKQYEEMKKEVK